MSTRDPGDADSPLSRTGGQVWRFLVLLGSISVAIIAMRSEVLSIAALAAEQRTAPLRADVEALKKQSDSDQELLKTLRRNVYRLCLANQVKDCEP